MFPVPARPFIPITPPVAPGELGIERFDKLLGDGGIHGESKTTQALRETCLLGKFNLLSLEEIAGKNFPQFWPVRPDLVYHRKSEPHR
jgi:hypothetical protein